MPYLDQSKVINYDIKRNGKSDYCTKRNTLTQMYQIKCKKSYWTFWSYSSAIWLLTIYIYNWHLSPFSILGAACKCRWCSSMKTFMDAVVQETHRWSRRPEKCHWCRSPKTSLMWWSKTVTNIIPRLMPSPVHVVTVVAITICSAWAPVSWVVDVFSMLWPGLLLYPASQANHWSGGFPLPPDGQLLCGMGCGRWPVTQGCQLLL